MKTTFFLAALIFTSCAVKSQDGILSEYYPYDQKIINPAFAGLADAHSIVLASNLHTGTFDGMPAKAMLSFDTRLSKIKSGVGAVISHEKVGVHKSLKHSILYNYQIRTSKSGQLSLGVALSHSHFVSDYSRLGSGAPLQGIVRATEFNYDLGISYSINKALFGFSVQNLAEPFSPLQDLGFTNDNWKNSYFYLQREFSLASWLQFTPSFLYISRPLPDVFQVNGFANIGRWFVIGAQYGTNETKSVFGGISYQEIFEMCVRLHTHQDQMNAFYAGDRFSFMLKARIKKSAD